MQINLEMFSDIKTVWYFQSKRKARHSPTALAVYEIPFPQNNSTQMNSTVSSPWSWARYPHCGLIQAVHWDMLSPDRLGNRESHKTHAYVITAHNIRLAGHPLSCHCVASLWALLSYILKPRGKIPSNWTDRRHDIAQWNACIVRQRETYMLHFVECTTQTKLDTSGMFPAIEQHCLQG